MLLLTLLLAGQGALAQPDGAALTQGLVLAPGVLVRPLPSRRAPLLLLGPRGEAICLNIDVAHTRGHLIFCHAFMLSSRHSNSRLFSTGGLQFER